MREAKYLDKKTQAKIVELFTKWCVERYALAERFGVSEYYISKILEEGGVKPYRVIKRHKDGAIHAKIN